MSSFRIRPRFSHSFDEAPERMQARIVEHAENAEALAPRSSVEVKNFPSYATLCISVEDQHLWPPLLNLSRETDDEGRTVIHGIYGLNANVRTIFLYGYLLFGLLTLFSGLLGISQWVVGVNSWGLIVFSVLAVLLIGLYPLTQFGQKPAARQTYLLHHTCEAAVGRAVEIH